MGPIRGWAWVWLVLGFVSSVYVSLTMHMRLGPALSIVHAGLPYGAVVVGVVVAQERFSAIRALVAIVLAFGTRWLLLRVYFAVYTPAMSRVGRTAQYVTVLGCVLFVAATVVALVALRSSPTFGWALVTAFVMLALPLALGFLIEGLSYPKDAAVIAAGAVFVAFLGTALSVAGTWVGTLVSRLVPGANRAAEA